MKAGDAFFCTQRLATLLATNTRADQTMFVFFHISHVDHAVLKGPALQSMWLEFKNIASYLGDENAGIILTPTEVIGHSAAAAQPNQDLLDFSNLSDASNSNQQTAAAASPPPPPPAVPLAVASPYGVAMSRSPSSIVPATTSQATTPHETSMNPLFSGAHSGYAPVNTVDDQWRTYNQDEEDTRPSNNIELQSFGSNKK